MSANDKHPRGLANGSDQVGRNYMFHNSQAVLAVSLEPNPTIFQKTIALNDFYFGMDGFEYPMGNIQMIGKSLGPMYRGEKPIETALLPMGLLDKLALPRGGFLAYDRGPARPGEPRDGEPGRRSDPELHPEQPGGPGRSCTTSSNRCWASLACTRII